MPEPGRPRVLDDAKRREICALMTAGYELGAAAEYVDCSLRTIFRELDRNPEFAERMGKARMAGELEPLQCVRQAARSNWRAAAWYLERTNVQRFAKRNPALMRPEDLRTFIECVVEIIATEVHDKADSDRAIKKLLAAATLIDRAAVDHENFVGSARPVSLDPKAKHVMPPLDEEMMKELSVLLGDGPWDESNIDPESDQ